MIVLPDLTQIVALFPGADPGGGSWGSGPPPFGGPPNFIKKEKMARACARKLRILVLNSYPDPPLSEILYPPLVSQPQHGSSQNQLLVKSMELAACQEPAPGRPPVILKITDTK